MHTSAVDGLPARAANLKKQKRQALRSRLRVPLALPGGVSYFGVTGMAAITLRSRLINWLKDACAFLEEAGVTELELNIILKHSWAVRDRELKLFEFNAYALKSRRDRDSLLRFGRQIAATFIAWGVAQFATEREPSAEQLELFASKMYEADRALSNHKQSSKGGMKSAVTRMTKRDETQAQVITSYLEHRKNGLDQRNASLAVQNEFGNSSTIRGYIRNAPGYITRKKQTKS